MRRVEFVEVANDFWSGVARPGPRIDVCHGAVERTRSAHSSKAARVEAKLLASRRSTMAKGQEKVKKDNKPKLSTKEKQQKKKEKKAAK